MLPHQGDRPGGRRDLSDELRLAGEPLDPHPQTLVALLEHAAARAPERAFLVERDARGAWRTLTFAQAADAARRLAPALAALGVSERRPLLILSGNGIDHARVMLGALYAGAPVAPVSAVMGRAAHDGFGRLRAIAAQVRPGAVFAADGPAYAPAVRAVLPDTPFITVTEPPRGMPAHDLARLAGGAPGLPFDAQAQTVAKILFTSGSTGEPKGVITTHGMVCAMQQSIAQAWPFLARTPPVMTDWLPWSHCFGGNKVLGIALRHAGTLYIDDGNPTPERRARTAALRAQVAPTLQFDVPLGWAVWLERLRGDDALRARWTARLELGSWGGATLPPATRDGLRALGVPLAAGWGATETAPTVTLTRGIDAAHDAIGVPVAGAELRLVPSGGDYEVRVRGPQVTPGYWWRPELTASAFDDEGFYRTGDLVRLIDARAPQRGLAFTARMDDRFKLSSGTWVRAAQIRDAFLALCPDAAEVLATGEGCDGIGLLVWPSEHGAQLPRGLLRSQVAQAMRNLAVGDGTAGRPRRALLVDDPPAADERTEKGTLVRRAVLRKRAALVGRLHASEPDADVIAL